MYDISRRLFPVDPFNVLGKEARPMSFLFPYAVSLLPNNALPRQSYDLFISIFVKHGWCGVYAKARSATGKKQANWDEW